MNFNLISKRLRAKIARISGELSRKMSKTTRRFVIEAVYGILSSQSVLLTEIGRSLEGEVKLKKVVERFCRQLGKAELWLSIHRELLSEISFKIKENTLLILDISDIRKKYGQRMEYIAEVRDGSENEIGKGYCLHVKGAYLNGKDYVGHVSIY